MKIEAIDLHFRFSLFLATLSFPFVADICFAGFYPMIRATDEALASGIEGNDRTMLGTHFDVLESISVRVGIYAGSDGSLLNVHEIGLWKTVLGNGQNPFLSWEREYGNHTANDWQVIGPWLVDRDVFTLEPGSYTIQSLANGDGDEYGWGGEISSQRDPRISPSFFIHGGFGPDAEDMSKPNPFMGLVDDIHYGPILFIETVPEPKSFSLALLFAAFAISAVREHRN